LRASGAFATVFDGAALLFSGAFCTAAFCGAFCAADFCAATFDAGFEGSFCTDFAAFWATAFAPFCAAEAAFVDARWGEGQESSALDSAGSRLATEPARGRLAMESLVSGSNVGFLMGPEGPRDKHRGLIGAFLE